MKYVWAPRWESLNWRRREDIVGVVIHRIEVSQEDPSYADTPVDVARFFAEHPEGMQATGGAMPYPILAGRDGEITQTVPLCRITPHAKIYNPTMIGVGCIGDFRTATASDAQYRAVVEVCSALISMLGLQARSLFGHDELVGGSGDPNKICPGPGLPLSKLRQDVEMRAEISMPFVW